ncbi:MAG: glycosyltransferase [Elusimicrobia bacterium]|nr:glycosyltransferase [Elusimicrobiota bacterium]MBD3412122.1 glycosyltransferase [Elusimicrobiota bacterium]
MRLCTKMPLTILHVDTEKTWRGGERQAYFLIRALTRAQYVNIVAAPRSGEFAKRTASLPCTHVDCDPWGEWDMIAGWKLSRIAAVHKVDIIHAHTAHALGVCALASLFSSARLVASRRVDFHLKKHMFSSWKYGRADMIIAISNGIKNVLREDNIPDDKITVVHSGVEIDKRIKGVAPQSKQSLHIPDGALVVGAVGALAPHKDHLTLCKAALMVRKKIPSVVFLIVGDGPLRDKLKCFITQNQLERTVIMTGFRNDVDDLIEIMDVYAVSSYLEGMGTATLDAMVFKKPVVATRTGGIPEIVADNHSGYLVPPRDPQALAEKIIDLVEQPDLRERFGKNGFERVHQFSVEAMAEKTMAVYARIMHAQAAGEKHAHH